MSEDAEAIHKLNEEVIRKLGENRAKRDQDWSMLNSQVIGGEVFPMADHEKIEKLKQRIAELERELANLTELIGRASPLGPVEELRRILEDRQRLEKENGELRAGRPIGAIVGAQALLEQEARLDAGLKERNQLTAQVLRLREAILSVRNDGKGPVEDAITLSKALTESPAQAASALVGPTIELLEWLNNNRYSLPKCTVEPLNKEIARLKWVGGL